MNTTKWLVEPPSWRSEFNLVSSLFDIFHKKSSMWKSPNPPNLRTKIDGLQGLKADKFMDSEKAFNFSTWKPGFLRIFQPKDLLVSKVILIQQHKTNVFFLFLTTKKKVRYTKVENTNHFSLLSQPTPPGWGCFWWTLVRPSQGHLFDRSNLKCTGPSR